MRVRGDGETPPPLPVNTAAAERHNDNNAPAVGGGGSAHRGDAGQLCKDPLCGILLICIYGFILSLPPKHGDVAKQRTRHL